MSGDSARLVRTVALFDWSDMTHLLVPAPGGEWLRCVPVASCLNSDGSAGLVFVQCDDGQHVRVAGASLLELPVFYTLPAELLEEGMSTDDGQDILDVGADSEGWVFASVYTPRSDDPDLDEENRGEPETRMYGPREAVGLAVFPDTENVGLSLVDDHGDST
jgi:hypothetical protein